MKNMAANMSQFIIENSLHNILDKDLMVKIENKLNLF
jgi:hypothetical protein